MKIYPKKLRGIEDLEREKKRLSKECARMDEEGFLSLDGILGKGKGKSKGDSEEGGNPLLGLLAGSNPIVDIVMKFVQQKMANKAAAAEYAPQGAEKKKGKNRLKKIAIEFIGGYLKWKAIELSYKGVRYIIKKRKEKKAGNSQ